MLRTLNYEKSGLQNTNPSMEIEKTSMEMEAGKQDWLRAISRLLLHITVYISEF